MKQLPLFAPAKEDLSLGPKSNYSDYQTYLRSPEWKKKRERAFKLLGRKCQQCGKTKSLQVHHLHYDTLYEESAEDVEIACTDCHPVEDIRRADKKGYDTWLRNKYGDDGGSYDDEIEYEKFQNWKYRDTY
jgi:5-methylcytosine-specific restriction endonuclease McrA